MSKRILFVDDDISLVNATEMLLSRLGYSVEAHHDAEIALARLVANPQSYSVLICDARMARVSGVDLANVIKLIAPDMPVILCSGYFTAADVQKANAAGITELVDKPYSGAQLKSVIDRVLTRQNET